MAPSKPKAHSSESESKETLHARPPRVWSSEEDIVILNGMLQYKKYGMIPTSSSAHVEPLHALISESFSMKASTNQLSQKMRSLKKKHRRNAHQKFSNKKFFKLANKIWGRDNPKSPSMALFMATFACIKESGNMETYCIEEGLKFLEGRERVKLEERWTRWRNAQAELVVERAELVHEQTMLLSEGNKGVDDQD